MDNLPFFENPKTDGQLLFNYQYQYKNGDAQALALMYELLKKIAYKNINDRSNSDKLVAELNAATRRQKAHDATTYIIEQYLKRPDFVINKSVTGYLYKRVTWELLGREHQNKRDQIIVYTDTLPEAKQTKTKYKYLVRNLTTGNTVVYESAAELYLNPAFKGLRKKRLAESIRTGRKWKNYTFDLLEVTE